MTSLSTLTGVTAVGKLQGKVAVITGGATGIGLAAAHLFVKEGAQVFITGRRQKELEQAVRAIGINATGVEGDVANLSDLDRLYETVKAAGRRIDIVCFGMPRQHFAATRGAAPASLRRTALFNVAPRLFTPDQRP